MKDKNDTLCTGAKRYVRVKDELGRVPVCERTFRALIRKGIIPSYRPGRRILLVPDEVDRAIAARFRREAPQPA